MKNTILSIVLLAVLSVSCNQKNTEKQAEKTAVTKTNSEVYACSMHPEIIGKKGAECSVCGMELTEKVAQKTTTKKEQTLDVESQITEEPEAILKTKNASQATFPTDPVVIKYLKIKNALTKDDSKAAATAAKIIVATLNSTRSTSLDTKSKSKYNAMVTNAKSHAKQIADNDGKIDRQRAYFSLLSTDVYDLIKAFGTTETVYQDYCPMYEAGKTGYWISETTDVINPYFGAEMLNCGRRIALVK